MPQVCWAYESQMDDIARRLGIDPLELRLKNLVQEGDEFVTGDKLVSVGISRLSEGRGAGGGMAGERRAVYKRGYRESARQGIGGDDQDDDDAVELIGAGEAQRGWLGGVADEQRGDWPRDADLAGADCGGGVGDSAGAGERDVSRHRCYAVRSVDEFEPDDIYDGERGAASGRTDPQATVGDWSQALEANVEDLELVDGNLQVKGAPEKRRSISQLFQAHYGAAVGSMAGSYDNQTRGGVDPQTGKGKASAFFFLSACAVEVEVDTETGKVTMEQIVSAVDAGKAVNPRQCHLQNEGSMIMSLGSALFEEMVFDNGQPINSTFLEYMPPSMEDHPRQFQSVIMETPHPEGPFGAKGVGEAALGPVEPAIGNAIANALGGLRLKDLPLRPDRIMAAVQKSRLEKKNEFIRGRQSHGSNLKGVPVAAIV